MALVVSEADSSFPVNPEVGKIGTQSPTYIQPVSERADGIKSFFSKQSPAKVQKEKPQSSRPADVKDEKPDQGTVKAKGGEEESMKNEDLGDDSNAPNPDSGKAVKEETKTPTKRAREEVKQAGRQTKVTRKSSDGEGKPGVSPPRPSRLIQLTTATLYHQLLCVTVERGACEGSVQGQEGR